MKANHPKERQYTRKLLISIYFIFVIASLYSQKGNIVLTDNTQENFLKAYQLVFNLSDKDYRSSNPNIDAVLFPKYGEFSIYWILSGIEQGNFVIPDSIPSGLRITVNSYDNYDWHTKEHRSIQFKNEPKKNSCFSK